MIFLNREFLGPRLETMTTYGLAGAGLVVAAGRQGIAEVRYRRRRFQTGYNMAVRAVPQAVAEPAAAPPLAVEAESNVVQLPEPTPAPNLALSA